MKTRILQILGVAAVATIGMVSCDTDPCKDVDCGLDGQCVDGDCVCPDGFGGADCSTDYCATLVCDATGGDELAVEGGCDCVCNAGYEGADCATEQREKFIATYNVNESCTSGNFTYAITGTTSSADVTTIILTNFGDYNVNVTATVNANGTSITIPSQTVGGGTFSGSGQLSGSILTITYTVTAGTSTDTCTMTCTKQ